MAKYNSIAVIYGSDSSEWEVSCRSGEYIAANIDDTKYDIYEIFARFGVWQLVAFKKKNAMRVPFPEGSRPQVDKTDFSVTVYGEKVKFDYAYIAQHGMPGETGNTQGYLEMLGVPFSGCNAFVSAIAFDKFSSKSYLKDIDFVKCSPDALVRKGEDLAAFTEEVRSKLNFPVFVKPTTAGSSFGITKVHKPEDLPKAVRYAFSESSCVLVEQGLKGRELTCAAYTADGKVSTLPVIEIITENDYFDYDAKYNGHSREVCPAEIDTELESLVRGTTVKIYQRLGCAGLVRVDYISTEEGLYFLEVNTIPGMTSASLVPKMVRTAGMQMTDFLSGIIENDPE